jgi:formate hydrogenlyase subunit 6/NADH:ubiquinone oxidoreductase subunit I
MFRNLFSKPSTILYPSQIIPIPKGFRGKVVICDEKCVGCSKCSQVCPAMAISMIPDEREVEFKGKKIVRKKRPRVKLFKCIRCGLCERHCPNEAIHLVGELSCTGTDCEAAVT